MNRAELRAEKEAIRARIDVLRANMNTKLYGSTKLPERIINGSHQAVTEFKTLCDDAGDTYHVNHAPGAKKTVSELESIESRLTEFFNQLS